MDKELQNLLDNYEQVIYGYAEPIIPSINQINLLLDYISQLSIQVKKQKEVIDKAIDLLNNPWSFESGNKEVDDITYNKKRKVIDILKENQNE